MPSSFMDTPRPVRSSPASLREVGVKAEIIGSSATSNQNYPELVGKIGAGTNSSAR